LVPQINRRKDSQAFGDFPETLKPEVIPTSLRQLLRTQVVRVPAFLPGVFAIPDGPTGTEEVRLITQRTHTFSGNYDDGRGFMIIGDSIPCVFMVVSDVFPFGLMVIPVIDSITFVPIAARAESSP
jgi:hypothetical protein